MKAETTEYDSAVCRGLRKQIQAVRIKRLGWSDQVFYFIMEGLGYGRSLRALDEARLTELWSIIRDYRKHGRPAEFTYDKQGRYMHALAKKAEWPERTLIAFMTMNFKKTHWNLLGQKERQILLKAIKTSIKKEEV